MVDLDQNDIKFHTLGNLDNTMQEQKIMVSNYSKKSKSTKKVKIKKDAPSGDDDNASQASETPSRRRLNIKNLKLTKNKIGISQNPEHQNSTIDLGDKRRGSNSLRKFNIAKNPLSTSNASNSSA